ncbi:RHS repeat-associated core domain-containing protein, partial [Verrucomicrobium sp. BvORR034]|uniref:RHS repeat-associated core domain-containing protein n=1 Tax=Verrucomicrobium sp. BvORR034 TaxID=1396418 RepID=UPI002240F916
EAYGKRPVETGTNPDRQRANTKEEDPTGLLNEGFRYRDIETGVWLSRDPAGFVDGPNVYAYVRQNPWTSFDPEGLDTKTVTKPEQPAQRQEWEVSKTNVPTIVLYDGSDQGQRRQAAGGDQFRDSGRYYTTNLINIGVIVDSKGDPVLDRNGNVQHLANPEMITKAFQETGATRVFINDHSTFAYWPTKKDLTLVQEFHNKPLTPESPHWKSLVSTFPSDRKTTVVLCACDGGNGGTGGPAKAYLQGLYEVAKQAGKNVEVVAYGQTMYHTPSGVSGTPIVNGRIDPKDRERGSEFRAPQDTQ